MMHFNFKNKTGKTFGYLKVLNLAKGVNSRQGKRLRNILVWRCRCKCGKVVFVRGDCLGYRTNSCGCLVKINNGKRTHGLSGTSEYKSWVQMYQRCQNKKRKDYKYYGGRGIRVTRKWKKFETFFKDMGPKPLSKRTIERINVNKDYCKSNCRWASQIEQVINCRSNVKIRFKGRKQTLTEWARELHISKGTVFGRYYREWPIKELFSTKDRRYKK